MIGQTLMKQDGHLRRNRSMKKSLSVSVLLTGFIHHLSDKQAREIIKVFFFHDPVSVPSSLKNVLDNSWLISLEEKVGT